MDVIQLEDTATVQDSVCTLLIHFSKLKFIMLQIVYFTLGAEVDGVELTVTHAYLVRDAVSLQQKDIFRSLLLLGTNFSHVIVLVVLIIIKFSSLNLPTNIISVVITNTPL